MLKLLLFWGRSAKKILCIDVVGVLRLPQKILSDKMTNLPSWNVCGVLCPEYGISLSSREECLFAFCGLRMVRVTVLKNCSLAGVMGGLASMYNTGNE